MILSLRHIRRRIRSVENTKKMTRAMEMVAASKLKKLQELLKQSDRYIGDLGRILETLVREKPLAHPLLEKRPEPKTALIFLITSDTGLCGSYNTNVLERAQNFLKAEFGKTEIHFASMGKHGALFLKRIKQKLSHELSIPRPTEIDGTIQKITQIAKDEFTSAHADRVVFIYTKVASLGSLKPNVEQLFPIVSSSPLVGEDRGGGLSPHPNLPPQRGEGNVIDYLIEPDLNQVLDLILPEFIEAQVGQFVKHSLVAEQASRMLAMRQATDSAKDMIENLTLLRNKARQATITKELIEVVSGSRAQQMN